ncbi:MAG: endonuclease/exonuclease/phosphatase family protein [Syntrophothermus sp.]
MNNIAVSSFMMLLLLCSVINPGQKPGVNPIRVMTYNIRYAGSVKSDSVFAWENRKQMVASTIDFNKAEIVGVQEALKLQLDDFARLLPEYKIIGVGRDDGKEAGEYSAILYRPERFLLLNSATFWLSETPDKVSRGWDAACNRVVTWGEFKDKLTGKIFFHFNTHFDHIGVQARTRSAELLLKKIEEIAIGRPVVVTGDFNFTSDSKYYGMLTENKENGGSGILKDAQKISKNPHYGENISFNDFGRNTDPENKIDYIFIKNNVEVVNHGIIAQKFNGRYPSDHMPVAADVTLY